MDRMLTVTSRAMWRRWLSRNHDKAIDVWLVFFKQHTGEPSIPYDDTVEEALCFGWIDSLIQRIDDDRYGRKFTPRKNDTKWSPSNKARVAKLIAEGKMTAAGLAKVAFPQPDVVTSRRPSRRDPKLTAGLERLLRANRVAWESFRGLAPSHRRHYLAWITAAKKAETQRRRLDEAIRLLVRGEKLGMK
jgi:uncharacterized protein YdeI (YjbR/CyaY-like superfamily)